MRKLDVTSILAATALAVAVLEAPDVSELDELIGPAGERGPWAPAGPRGTAGERDPTGSTGPSGAAGVSGRGVVVTCM